MKIVPAGIDGGLVDALESQGPVGLEFAFLSGHALELVKEAQRRTGLSAQEVIVGALEDYVFGLGLDPGTTEQRDRKQY